MPPSRTPAAYMAANVVLAVAAVALAAQISVPIPGTPVPQSLQTLAVVLAGAWLGPVWGAFALVLYVVAGAIGLPVFADGAAGMEHLYGPTMGYLVGFVAGAAFTGWVVARSWSRPWANGFGGVLGAAIIAHILILGCGWMRLAAMLGPAPAFESGVTPFVVGGVVKSVVAAVVWLGVEWSSTAE